MIKMGGDSDHTLVAVVAFGFFGLLGLLAFLATRPKPPPPPPPAPTMVVYEQTEKGFVITEKPLRPITSAGFKLVKLGSKREREEALPRFKPVKVGEDEWVLAREE